MYIENICWYNTRVVQVTGHTRGCPGHAENQYSACCSLQYIGETGEFAILKYIQQGWLFHTGLTIKPV